MYTLITQLTTLHVISFWIPSLLGRVVEKKKYVMIIRYGNGRRAS